MDRPAKAAEIADVFVRSDERAGDSVRFHIVSFSTRLLNLARACREQVADMMPQRLSVKLSHRRAGELSHDYSSSGTKNAATACHLVSLVHHGSAIDELEDTWASALMIRTFK